MRTALLAALVFPIVCLAAPVPAGATVSPAARRELHAEALTFAQQTLSVATQVSAGYMRPVSRNELLLAAVRGLFEAARLPAPSGLEADLKRLTTEEGLIDFLVTMREQAGNAEAIRGKKALLASCRGMLHSLDDHSDVVTEEERKPQPWGDQPACLGLELADNVGVGPQHVLRVYPGTPAQRAGIRPGDTVTHLDGKPLKGMTTAEAAGLIKEKAGNLSRLTSAELNVDLPGPDATPVPVTLELRRPGRKPWKVTLDFQEARPESVFGVSRRDDNSWNFLIDRERKIAHVRVEMLNRGTAVELADVLTRLEADGLRGLILDLRWSSGGFLDEAIGIAGLFVGDCVIATVRDRHHEEVQYHNTQPKRFPKLPVVVLVNGQTTGGSELIAAALQDHKRAAIAGQRTLGKATVQTALYVDIPGASIKLTSGEFLRPSGKNLHRRPESGPRDDWGIRPDRELEFPLSPQLAKELKEQWHQQTLRPGSDVKILPLDDPSADPQRQHALQWLQTRISR
jgi:carboxyl-terminal processing protease